ncbi:hypothetical protein MAR_021241 [Mya arenaria]|uniref:Ig-like domain-containing protein n=1 Tax=Mya arenaria TaxID=6604 RepID=A0ABY7E782_MYAAR|nr:hypothetical protein MAR_021241 [Mya arenaria]
MNLLNAVCLTVSICVIFAKTEISLDVGTCGNNTTLTCSGSGTFSWDIQKGYELLVGKGDVLEETKYSVIVSSTSVKLTIHNTDISDIGIYACEVAYDGRTSNITATVNNLGRVELSTDRLYPMHKDFQVSVFQGKSNYGVQLNAKSVRAIPDILHAGGHRMTRAIDDGFMASIVSEKLAI